jgi:hypothetical protein
MTTSLNHVFIDTIPDELEEGKLYISPRFRVIMHSCCCGCKNKVVTPLSPARWKMTFDGSSISISPSIGNWNFDCKSHYWIQNNEVEWARKWSDHEVAEGKLYEREKREEHFKKTNKEEKTTNEDNLKISNKVQIKQSLFVRMRNLFKNVK